MKSWNRIVKLAYFWVPIFSLNLYLCNCLANHKPLDQKNPSVCTESQIDSRYGCENVSEPSSPGRRKLLDQCLIAPIFLLPQLSSATDVEPNLDCLLDLPPIPTGNVRLFLCRHGQTENNRLRKVQGARVDPPINDNGKLQATNLGKALSRISPGPPQTFFSSNLLRAKMTAEIAASQVDPTVKPTQLSSLAEVDFGPFAEGQPIAVAKVGMEATAAAWAIGRIDYRPSAGGDSARDVFARAIESLKLLTEEASSTNGMAIAVAHSTFLRILIAMVLDESLAEAESRKIVNGSVTVLDLPKSFECKTIGPKANLIGGKFSLAPEDFSLDVPVCNVVRVNESRHLPVIA